MIPTGVALSGEWWPWVFAATFFVGAVRLRLGKIEARWLLRFVNQWQAKLVRSSHALDGGYGECSSSVRTVLKSLPN